MSIHRRAQWFEYTRQQLNAATVELPTAFTVKLPCGVEVQLDPIKSTQVKMGDKVVGFIKTVRAEHDTVIADVIITDPQVRALVCPPKVNEMTLGFKSGPLP